MRSRLFGVLGLLSLAAACPAAPPGIAPLRIGLVKSFARATVLLVSCDKPWAVKDSNTGETLAKAGGGAVTRISVSPLGLTLTPQDMSPESAPTVRDQLFLSPPRPMASSRSPAWTTPRTHTGIATGAC